MPLTITTWNLQNFRQNDPVFPDKLDFIVSTLQALDPDVVALQEVLDPQALTDLANRLGYQQVVAAPDPRGIRVAFLTRQAPSGQSAEINAWRLPAGVIVQDFDSNGAVGTLGQMPRAALRITVSHGGSDVDVITTHLKSKLLTFDGNFSTSDETRRANAAYFALQRRASEATTLREHTTDALAAGHNVVLLGDLNDGPGAATTEILYGPPGDQIRVADDISRPASAFQRSDAEDARRLFNVTKVVPEEERWSRKHEGQKELLDHILASEGLMPRAGNLRQVPIVSILNEDVPNLSSANPNVAGAIPDHAAVTATFA